MISTRIASLAAACVIGGASTVASAALQPYTFTITGGSSLAVGGQFGGANPTNAQPGTTFNTNYTGTIAVEIDHAANLIYFPGGSQLNAGNQPVNVDPFTDSTPGSAPGNYGREGNVQLSPLPPMFGVEAIRNLRLDVETAVIGTPSSYNSTTGEFISGDLGMTIDQGNSDFLFGSIFGETDLASSAFSLNQAVTASTLTSDGTTETLTLRLQSGLFPYTIVNTNDSSVSFGGTIIATRAIVPEPASLAVLGLSGLSLLARRRRGA